DRICGAACLQIVGIRFVRLADRDSILLSGQSARSDPKPENSREIKDFCPDGSVGAAMREDGREDRIQAFQDDAGYARK
ncbi:MAG: hypothetical protein J7517_13895, partial [Sphingobium yanoikuyae]|nr:hypothetical protein [Sphingobium yanoikuyae]